MTIRKIATVVGIALCVTLIGVFAVSTVLADTPTPTPQTKSPLGWFGMGRGFGCFGGGSTATFDAVAKALNLTPTQLFEQMHSGKTLTEIAEAQGVDLQKVQDAVTASQTQSMKDAIAQAVKDGTMTQAQADWLLQGLDQGFLPKGKGFGFGGRMMRGGMRGLGMWGEKQAPATPVPGASS